MSAHKGKAPEPTATELRDAVLRRMGPLDGPCYAEGAAKLLDSYVAKLEENWRWYEAFKVRCRAEEVVRTAIAGMT